MSPREENEDEGEDEGDVVVADSDFVSAAEAIAAASAASALAGAGAAELAPANCTAFPVDLVLPSACWQIRHMRSPENRVKRMSATKISGTRMALAHCPAVSNSSKSKTLTKLSPDPAPDPGPAAVVNVDTAAAAAAVVAAVVAAWVVIVVVVKFILLLLPLPPPLLVMLIMGVLGVIVPRCLSNESVSNDTRKQLNLRLTNRSAGGPSRDTRTFQF